MKIFLCIGLIFSFSSFAYNDGEKCLEEALESSIALKIYKLAAGNCSNLNRDKYRELEQTRQNKRRFFNEAVKGLNSGNKISDHSLAHVCQKVMKLKKQACHESKIVFHAFSGSNSGAKGKRE